jgi:O-antigen/teichoic acid export membrane protein
MELSDIAEESAKGSFSLMTGLALSTAIGAAVVILMARLLGPSGYGLYTLALVGPTLFVAIADFGLSPSITRFTANLRSEGKYSQAASMIKSAVLFALLASSIAFLLAYASAAEIAAVLQRPEISFLVIVASFTIVFSCLFNITYNALVGCDRMGRSAVMLVLRDATRLVFSPLLIVVGFGVAGAIAGQVVGWVAGCALGLTVLLLNRSDPQGKKHDTDEQHGITRSVSAMMSYGTPLYASSLLAQIVTQYQTIVLAFFTSNAEIGSFRAAVNFGSLIGIFATPVATALFPAFSKLDLRTRKVDLESMFDHAVKYTTLLIVPVAVVIAALSRDFIRAVYGVAYASASTYLALYVATFLLSAIGSQAIGAFLNGVGKTKETLKITLVQLITFLPSAPFLAWLLGVSGVIIALILSTLVSISFGLWLAVHQYGMRVDLRASLRILLAATISAVPLLPMILYSPLPSYANAALGALIYAAAYLTLIPLLKALTRSDLQLLTPILKQIKPLQPLTDLIITYENQLLNITEKTSH